MNLWPFKKKPDLEQRSAFPVVTQTYIDARRKGLSVDGAATLSATAAVCAGVWSRAFSMLVAEPSPDLLTPDILASIGLDLLLKGESVWHIRLEDGDLSLVPVAYWDLQAPNRYVLHIAKPHSIETVKALEQETLRLVINPDPVQPWRGRSPFALMGLSPTLLAEIEQAISGALPFAGKGLLPMPSTIAPEQQSKVLSGLQNGALAVVTSKADFQTHAGGDRSEMKRVDLTPDMSKMGLQATHDALHTAVLSAAGIPPGLFAGGQSSTVREQYRLFALTTLDPLSRIIQPELKRKLGIESLSLRDTMSADTAGRARSVSSLVQSGVPLKMAMSLCGWEVDLPDTPTDPKAPTEPTKPGA
jgi:hypothetical protein